MPQKYAWTMNQEDVLNLGKDLVERGEITTVDGLLDFFEKPWHWDAEWQAFITKIHAGAA